MTESARLTTHDLFTLSGQGARPRVIVTEPDGTVHQGTFVMMSPDPGLKAKALVQLAGEPAGTYNNYPPEWIQIDDNDDQRDE